ncbi:class I SAM-dependent methyltransferase [Flavisolibacter tropicus]|uniref:Methyltransferase domain-containing protein n=1 Tax=Flavisolibacter tropicus TaxID=1492898 RepID=A0A172TVH0_9BACT|nr:class I SAM-dependent methyltransferase [Flavisolibacter tropicus]ANE51121.1 hypothetical protein SY85_12025 [Flavisolibacter tropicus]
MKTIQENSYQKNVFVDFEEESKRLTIQATFLHQVELDILIRHGLKEHHDVLDIGCGQGFLAHLVSGYLTSGQIDGVDINAAFVQEAQQTFLSPNLRYHCSAILEYTPEKQYDFIYARLLFQHLKDPLTALLHLKQYLKPGGRICIIDVNDEWLFLEPSLPAFDRLVNASIDYQQKQGGNRLIAKALPNLLRNAGLGTPQLEIVPFSSDIAGMKLFLEVAISFRANYAYSDIHGLELYHSIKESILNASEPYFGLMGVSCISACNDQN